MENMNAEITPELIAVLHALGRDYARQFIDGCDELPSDRESFDEWCGGGSGMDVIDEAIADVFEEGSDEFFAVRERAFEEAADAGWRHFRTMRIRGNVISAALSKAGIRNVTVNRNVHTNCSDGRVLEIYDTVTVRYAGNPAISVEIDDDEFGTDDPAMVAMTALYQVLLHQTSGQAVPTPWKRLATRLKTAGLVTA